jgi:hypothetical protein
VQRAWRSGKAPTGVAALLIAVAAALGFAPRASAAITHEFLPVSGELGKGVEGAIPGPLSGVNALAADGGQLWVAERIEAGTNLGRSRVDSFDEITGQWLPPQFGEEREVSHLETGVAVGHAGGEAQTYVGAGVSGKNVVAVYGPGGKLQPEGIWEGTQTPAKAFNILKGLAIDHSGNLETQGDVYVATAETIDVYPGVAGGAESAPLGQIEGSPEAPSSGGHFAEVRGVAVSPTTGDVFVSDGKPGECAKGEAECVVDVFEPAGLPGTYTFLFKITGPPGQPFKRLGPIAVDGEGDIYVLEKDANVVDQFSPTGEYRGQLTGTGEGAPFHSLSSIAADRETGMLFVGDYDESQTAGAVDVFGPTLVVPDVRTEPATGVAVDVKEGQGEAHATLNGSVNPLSEGEATCEFAWGTSEALGQLAACEPPGVPDGASPVPRSAKLTGLLPDTTYFFRLRASNHNGTNPGEPPQTQSFMTPGPGIHSASVSDVAATSATLHASIDPNGAPTSYYFQYGRSTSYEASVPAPPGEAIGSGEEDVQVAPRHIQGLSPQSTYHYRVVAVSTLQVEGKATQVTFTAPDQSFITQEGSSSGAELPDERRWELVSPPDKHGALLSPIGETGVIQASASGSSISYLANIPTEETVKGFLYNAAQVLSDRGPAGWSSLDISLPHVSTRGLPVGLGREYRFFSGDGCTAVVEPFGEFTSLAPEVFPPESERTPYLRHSCECPAAPSSCYEPLLTGAPGYADVPSGTEFGGSGQLRGRAQFLGASPDAQHVILAAEVALTPTEAGGEAQLYEFSANKPPAERLQLISLLPANGEGKELPASRPELGDGRLARDAVSADGSKVIFSDGEGHLYERDTAAASTVQLDVPEAACVEAGGCSSGGGARYQAASADGSRVLFTDTQRLLAGSGHLSAKPDLYECRIEAGACELTDLTAAPGPGQSADVQGALLGTSEDGSWVYFVADGVLGDGAESGASQGDCKRPSGSRGEGGCSLYVEHEGQVRFIAQLSGEDYPDWTELHLLNVQTARVSPDGQYLAFMSERSLTGYDNHDKVSGEADEEVYLYSARSGKLSCASCNPSGARPSGVDYRQIKDGLVSGDGVWPDEAWIAANVPGWTPFELSHALHQPRYLSNSGRLFFNSSDALVAQDINGNQDVYEFEPAGVGGCSSSSTTYVAVQGGCLALVSSGRASGESGFLDASESGDDVFFLTNERLVSKDVDTALDLYDAHVCSAAAPCFEEGQAAPSCVTAEACRAAPTPQPSIFGPPSSATFSGQGNLPPQSVGGGVKPTRAQLLAKALKRCRVRYSKQKRRRARCVAQARRRYGPHRPAKGSRKPAKGGKKT